MVSIKHICAFHDYDAGSVGMRLLVLQLVLDVPLED